MIPRYTRPKMGAIWAEESRFARWLQVEIAATRAWESVGRVPAGTADAIEANARIDVDRINEIEAEVKHDVVAFVSQVAETCGDEGRWIHYGLTSYDVVDTAQGIAMRDSAEMLIEGVTELVETVKRRALEHRDTLTMGRTHGIHGEPTSFGAKLAGYAFAFDRHLQRLKKVAEEVAVGKMAGPVGSYASVPPHVEDVVMSELGLKPEDAPTQIVSRDRHAAYVSCLAGLGSSIEELAVEIRHLARTEVREAEEPFDLSGGKGQKGSSSMPHKRNPWRSERLAGMARLLRGYAHASWENVATWHERDMSQSSVERVALADSSILADFAVAEITDIVGRMPVYVERMRSNLDRSFGLCFSQHVLLALVDAGLSRDDAYRIVQSAAMTSWEEERPYIEVLKEDDRTSVVDLDRIFDWGIFTANLDGVFERLQALRP